MLASVVARDGEIWTGYYPIGFEPNLLEFYAKRAPRSVAWAFPRIEEEDLGFYLPNDADAFLKNHLGIHEPEPARSRRLRAAEISGLVIPGLAFDSKCNRLGRGRGFFDRALAQLSNETNKTFIKIGVCFDRQISAEEIPVETHDIPMDWVVTETQTFSRDKTSRSAEKMDRERKMQ